jgi:hypothetical protein
MTTMNYRSTQKQSGYCYVLLLIFLLLSVGDISAQKTSRKEWKSLFNGKDLKNWDTYLRPSQAAADQTPIGLNKDPHQVFSVVDGTMKISGEDWGGISTKEEFENYHLRFQIKWGEKRWPPRTAALRDGGLLFHCSEPYDFGSTCWMRSNEMQIQEGEIGDFHNVGAGTSEFQVTPAVVKGEALQQYDPNSAIFMRYQRRVYRSGDFESRQGEWTTAEMIARGADAVFIVNGFVVNRTYNIFREDLQMQTTRGKLQFQSEGAEHYLKGIEIRPLPAKSMAITKLVSDRSEVVISVKDVQNFVITNEDEDVELIAAELFGKNIEAFIVKLPAFPRVFKKGEKITVSVSLKDLSSVVATTDEQQSIISKNNKVKFRLETAYGPVGGFEVMLVSE